MWTQLALTTHKLLAPPIGTTEDAIRAIGDPIAEDDQSCQFKDEYFMKMHDLNQVGRVSAPLCVH